jgi:hypothetical protein
MRDAKPNDRARHDDGRTGRTCIVIGTSHHIDFPLLFGFTGLSEKGDVGFDVHVGSWILLWLWLCELGLVLNVSYGCCRRASAVTRFVCVGCCIGVIVRMFGLLSFTWVCLIL